MLLALLAACTPARPPTLACPTGHLVDDGQCVPEPCDYGTCTLIAADLTFDTLYLPSVGTQE